jgi:hypothetical protein
MKSRRTLKPGQAGTKELVRTFGDHLVYVRYRYDIRRKLRMKTAEIIIEESNWEPGPDIMVWIRVGFDEIEIRNRIKAAGGKWNSKKKLWKLSYSKAEELALTDRITDYFV